MRRLPSFLFVLFTSPAVVCGAAAPLAAGVRVLAEALSDPVCARLTANPGEDLRRSDGVQLAFLDETPNHPEGVFWQSDVHGRVFAGGEGPPTIALYGEPQLRLLTRPDRLLDLGAACRLAWDFGRRHFPWMLRYGPYGRPTYRWPAPAGVVGFRWNAGAVELRVDVRLADAKVVAFGAVCPDYAHPGPLVQPGPEVLQPEPEPLPDLTVGEGCVILATPAWDGFVVWDRWPLWTRCGLVWSSRRPLAGWPDWVNRQDQVLCQTVTGPAALTAELSTKHRTAGATPCGSTLLLTRRPDQGGSYGYALDLSTAGWCLTHTWLLFSYGACPSPDGRWVVWAERPGAQPYDLVTARLAPADVLPGRQARVTRAGAQVLPCFSPDGRWLYCAESVRGQPQRPLQLIRLPVGAVLEPDGARSTEPADPILELPVACRPWDRLSITPDGHYLIEQTLAGIYLLDLPRRRCTKLALGGLTDPELNVPVHKLIDAWAGPGDDQVTFSGETNDQAGQRRRRIYSCRFDGTDLQALTPLTNDPVPLYDFPESDRTVLDVAREWALAELALEAGAR